jgi:DHA3 family macrolide efflux protein-like MFS transporter
MQQVMFGMRIIGPAIAAFMVAYLGSASCYVFDAVSFVASACLIASVALVRTAPKPAAPDAQNASAIGRIWLDMKQGISFIVHHAALLFVILAMAAGMFVIGCFGPLIAIYVRDSLRASTKMCLCGMAIGLVILTALPYVWTALIGNFIIGIAVAAIIVPAQTLFQQATPPELMGRVGSTFMSIIFAAQIAGLVLSGILTQHMGVRRVFALCAVMLVILIAVGKLWMEPKKAAV